LTDIEASLAQAREQAEELGLQTGNLDERLRRLEVLDAMFPEDPGIECYFEMLEMERDAQGS